MKLWFEYISLHPLIKYSNCLEVFLKIPDHKKFEDACQKIHKDRQVGANTFNAIQISDKIETFTDFQILVEIDNLKSQNQTFLDAVSVYSDWFSEIESSSAVYSKQVLKLWDTFETFSDTLERRNLELERTKKKNFQDHDFTKSLSKSVKVAVSEFRNLANHRDSLKSEKLVDYIENQTMFVECLKKLSDVADTVNSLRNQFDCILQAWRLAKLDDQQFSNANARLSQLFMIFRAERNHQIKINNEHLKKSITSFFRSHNRVLKRELDCYSRLAESFE